MSRISWRCQPGVLVNWAVVRDPGTIFERIEEIAERNAQAYGLLEDCRSAEPDAEFDLMRVLRNGTLTTEF